MRLLTLLVLLLAAVFGFPLATSQDCSFYNGNCASCNNQTNCAWCSGTATCSSVFDCSDACPCSAYNNDCSSCNAQASCAWCSSTSTCSSDLFCFDSCPSAPSNISRFLTVLLAILPTLAIFLLEAITVLICYHRTRFPLLLSPPDDSSPDLKQQLLVNSEQQLYEDVEEKQQQQQQHQDQQQNQQQEEGTEEDGQVDAAAGTRCSTPFEKFISCACTPHHRAMSFRERWQYFNDAMTRRLLYGSKSIVSFDLATRINRSLSLHLAASVFVTGIKIVYNLFTGSLNYFDYVFVFLEAETFLTCAILLIFRCGYFNCCCVWTCSCCYRVHPSMKSLYSVCANNVLLTVYYSSLSSTATMVSATQLLLFADYTDVWYRTSQFQKVILNMALLVPTMISLFHTVHAATRLWPIFENEKMSRGQAKYLIRWVRAGVEPFQYVFRSSTKISLKELQSSGLMEVELEQPIDVESVEEKQQQQQEKEEKEKEEEEQLPKFKHSWSAYVLAVYMIVNAFALPAVYIALYATAAIAP